ncbi:MAG TPA: D-alanyl-D-alanine carboxypeptidase [Sphingobacterium sp.]|nr:D-alanyl-D-alanine carboxypeptidase [Sphingobacterium sp.]
MVRIYTQFIGLCSLICSVSWSYGQDVMLLDSLFAQSRVLQKSYFGFSLYDIDSARYIYGQHADRHFTPASNVKVYTLYTALQTIGDSIPGIQYVERGDSLIFWGTGDPTFLHPKLDNGRVYNFLKNSGKELYYLSQNNPDGPFRNGWSIEDYNYSYQTDVVPFPIYGNLVRFVSDKGVLKAHPDRFDSMSVVRKERKRSFSIQRHLGDNVFELRGNIPRAYTTYKPFVWSDTLFAELLSDTLRLPVRVLKEVKSPYDKHVRVLYSASRNVVLREMMLPSDNFLAEQLSMVAAYSRYGDFLTDSLRKEMDSLYFSKLEDSVHLFDGSGLSTYNKITPNNMIALLLALNAEIADEYALRMFFPAGGVDGTLKNAYRLDKSGPFVWAKTGTLRSVYAQSGYLVTKSGRKMAFSFLNNNFVGSASTVRGEVVRLMTYIYDNF